MVEEDIYHRDMALSIGMQGKPLYQYEYMLAIQTTATPEHIYDLKAEIARLKALGLTSSRTIGGLEKPAFPSDPIPPVDLFPGVSLDKRPMPQIAGPPILPTPPIYVPPDEGFGPPIFVSETAEEFYGFETVAVTTTNGFDPSPLASHFELQRLQGKISLASWIVILQRIARLVAMRGRQFWDALPGWVRAAVIAAGLSLTQIDIDWPFVGDPDSRPFLPDRPVLPAPFIGPPAPLAPGGSMQDTSQIRVGGYWDGRVITNVWLANNILFWATGYQPHLMHWVLRKNGSIKGWKPQVPVVLMPNGAKDLRTLLRADAIVERQMKKYDKVYRRRHPRRAPRALSASRPMIAIESGAGSQVN